MGSGEVRVQGRDTSGKELKLPRLCPTRALSGFIVRSHLDILFLLLFLTLVILLDNLTSKGAFYSFLVCQGF